MCLMMTPSFFGYPSERRMCGECPARYKEPADPLSDLPDPWAFHRDYGRFPLMRQMTNIGGKKQKTVFFCSEGCKRASYKHLFDGKADERRKEREAKLTNAFNRQKRKLLAGDCRTGAGEAMAAYG